MTANPQQDMFVKNAYGLLEVKLNSRKTDPVTSKQAAGKIAPHLSELQREVLHAFEVLGEMTGGEAEKLTQFASCKPSTVRKRICEMARMCKLIECGHKDGMTLTVVKLFNNITNSLTMQRRMTTHNKQNRLKSESAVIYWEDSAVSAARFCNQ